MSSLSTSYVSPMGSWEKVYWTEGSAAAAVYCEKKRRGVKRAKETIDSLLEHVTSSSQRKDLRSVLRIYAAKMKHYEMGQAGRKRTLHGRARGGRTPFNRPSFRRRFSSLKEIEAYIAKKINRHAKCYEILSNLDEKYVVGSGLKKRVDILKSFHLDAFRKWKERNASEADLLPRSPESPLEIMNIAKAHRDGFKGNGAKARLRETDVDGSHPAICNQYEPIGLPSLFPPRDYHGTAVCGILCMTAPEGRVSSFSEQSLGVWRRTKKEIINWSGSLLGGGPDRRAAFYLENFETPGEKLVIQSCGNEGVQIDVSEVEKICRVSPVLSDPGRKDAWMFVVNLQQNGLYPSPNSNLPGSLCAKMTVSAIGEEISCAMPGQRYGECSGTSIAAPFVTGVAMLIQGRFPTLSLSDTRKAILKGATPIILDDTGVPRLIQRSDLSQFSKEEIARSRAIYGMGRLNADEALKKAAEYASTAIKSDQQE